MKIVLTLIFVFSLFSCVSNISPVSNTDIIESAVLWKAPIDNRTWVSPEFKALSENASIFQREGNFYKAISEINAFEHKVTYIGLKGINDVSGPNVFLLGDPESIANAITKKYGFEFEKKNNNYAYKLKDNVYLLVSQHPENKEQTAVIGIYTGN